MADDKRKKMLEGVKNTFGPQYDSDEDLDPETQEKIRKAYPSEQEKLRQEGWEKADMYPKLKKLVKSGWYGDKRKPRE